MAGRLDQAARGQPEYSLRAGEAVILIRGLHAIEVVEDMQCLRIKQGPFPGDGEDEVVVSAQA